MSVPDVRRLRELYAEMVCMSHLSRELRVQCDSMRAEVGVLCNEIFAGNPSATQTIMAACEPRDVRWLLTNSQVMHGRVAHVQRKLSFGHSAKTIADRLCGADFTHAPAVIIAFYCLRALQTVGAQKIVYDTIERTKVARFFVADSAPFVALPLPAAVADLIVSYCDWAPLDVVSARILHALGDASAGRNRDAQLNTECSAVGRDDRIVENAAHDRKHDRKAV